MTGSKGNSELCFLESVNFPITEGLGETKLAASRGATHEVFCYISQLKKRTNREKPVCLTLAGTQICRGFKVHEETRRKFKLLP